MDLPAKAIIAGSFSLLKKAGKEVAEEVVEEGAEAYTTNQVKDALREVYKKLDIDKPLPKGESGKFGSPTAGTTKKGYRLDPAHPARENRDINETVPHINDWDYTKGKRGAGGDSGAIPIIKPKQ